MIPRFQSVYWAWMMLAMLQGCGRNDAVGLSGESAEEPPSTPAPAVESPAASLRSQSNGQGTPRPPRPSRPGDGETVENLWSRAARDAPEIPVPTAIPSPAERIDPARLRDAGLRTVEGKHLLLVTDLAPSEAIDRLPLLFDAAVPHWAVYFGIAEDRWKDWRMTGYLMKDRAPFLKTRLLPDGLPPFPNGYTRGPEFWIYEQKTDYYRQHLLLHEGVHGFMFAFFGTCGPPWYMEGIAELLATHRWDGETITLPIYPRSKEEVPMLGRIRIVQDEISARRGRRLSQILDYGDRAHLRNEPYGWCWALAEFLDGHPAYRDRFRSLARHAGDVQFNQRLRKIFSDDWGRLNDAWLVFAFGIEHAYDFKRSAIDFQPGEPLGKASRTVTIDADRGWQSSRFALLAGTTYRIEAQGHYQVAKQADGTAWPCEPGGVTLRYYKGRPLGILLGAVVPEEVPLGVAPQDRVTPLVQPWTVGLGGRWTPKSSGTLYLRINDSAGQLGDNQGTLTVVVAQATAGR